MTPELIDMLGKLARAGWRFSYPRDDAGQIIAGYGVWVWPGGWWDGLTLHAENDALAFRADPEGMVTWHRHGTTLEMAHALLDLPRPGERNAPHLCTGRRAPDLRLPPGSALALVNALAS
ncbi:hypothetical protein ACTG9Q_24765 [Actinokineospora sp. 24-640]